MSLYKDSLRTVFLVVLINLLIKSNITHFKIIKRKRQGLSIPAKVSYYSYINKFKKELLDFKLKSGNSSNLDDSDFIP